MYPYSVLDLWPKTQGGRSYAGFIAWGLGLGLGLRTGAKTGGWNVRR